MPNVKITEKLLQVTTVREDGYEDIEHITRDELELKRAKLIPQRDHYETHRGYVDAEIAILDNQIGILDK